MFQTETFQQAKKMLYRNLRREKPRLYCAYIPDSTMENTSQSKSKLRLIGGNASIGGILERMYFAFRPSILVQYISYSKVSRCSSTGQRGQTKLRPRKYVIFPTIRLQMLSLQNAHIKRHMSSGNTSPIVNSSLVALVKVSGPLRKLAVAFI